MNRFILLLLGSILASSLLLPMSPTLKGQDAAASNSTKPNPLRIRVASVFAQDQAKALQFYTEILGFEKKSDVPLGEYRWLTVVSPENPAGTELLLEPNAHPAAKAFQKALFADKIPATVLFVDDLKRAFAALKARGVAFTTEPTEQGPVKVAVFDDTCGNLIQLVEEPTA